MRPAIDLQTLPYVETTLFELLNFSRQDLRIYDDPIADGADDTFAHHPRRNEMQLELLVSDPHGVAGVVAAGVAGDVPGVFSQSITHPSLTLVSPGQAQNYSDAHTTASGFMVVAASSLFGAKMMNPPG